MSHGVATKVRLKMDRNMTGITPVVARASCRRGEQAGFAPAHSASDPQPAPFGSFGWAAVLVERLRTRRNLNDLFGWRVG